MLISPFLELAKAAPELPCLYRSKDDGWSVYSRGEVVEAAMRLCAQWKADGLNVGDRLLILMENRPEWAVTAIASCIYGLVSVPAYTTHQDHEIQYLIEKSGAVAGVVSSGPLRSIKRTDVEYTIQHICNGKRQSPMFPHLSSVISLWMIIATKRILCLGATSGTNGLPKLVSLTQSNLRRT